MRGARGGAALVAAALLVVGGCGGDDESPEATATADTTAAADTTVAPGPTECASDLVLVASTNGGDEESGDVVGLTATGEVRRLSEDGAAFGPSVAPDGSRVVYAGIGPDGEVSGSFGPFNTDLYVVDADGTGRERLLDGGDDRQPDWSPTGDLIAFVRGGDPNSGEPPDRIHVVGADGTGDRELVAHDGPEDDALPVWSPDGERLAFVRYAAADGSSSQVVVVAVDGTGEEVVHEASTWVGRPAWSPDGGRLAFPEGETSQIGALTLLDLETGSVTTGPTVVDAPMWALNGRIYALAQPPAVRDVTGSWRIAELEVDGTDVAEGRPISALEPIHFAYTDYGVDVPTCLGPDAPPLTTEADVPEGLTVTDPATGEDVVVLTRDQAVQRRLDSVTDAPEGWGDAATTLLVYGDEATNAALCSQPGAAVPGEAVGEPDPDHEPPCRVEIPETLVWLVAVDGTLAAYDAVVGEQLFAGGGPDLTLPDVADLAPP